MKDKDRTFLLIFINVGVGIVCVFRTMSTKPEMGNIFGLATVNLLQKLAECFSTFRTKLLIQDFITGPPANSKSVTIRPHVVVNDPIWNMRTRLISMNNQAHFILSPFRILVLSRECLWQVATLRHDSGRYLRCLCMSPP